jgi:predicted amidophosphoribosyltransferase
MMGIGIGPMELIILAACPLTLGLMLAVVVVMAMASKRRTAGNLVNCPDCGNDVSTQATACPHCGRPMAT